MLVTVLGVFNKAIRDEKGVGGINIRKEENLSPFAADGMISFLSDFIKSTRKLLDLIKT